MFRQKENGKGSDIYIDANSNGIIDSVERRVGSAAAGVNIGDAGTWEWNLTTKQGNYFGSEGQLFGLITFTENYWWEPSYNESSSTNVSNTPAVETLTSTINQETTVAIATITGTINQDTTVVTDSLTGRSRFPDIFNLSGTPGYGSNADRITNFSTKDKDKVQISSSVFGLSGTGTFKIAKNLSALDKLSKSTTQFIYSKADGGLYFNQNGVTPGFGSGGIFAVLEGNPTLGTKNVSVVA